MATVMAHFRQVSIALVVAGFVLPLAMAVGPAESVGALMRTDRSDRKLARTASHIDIAVDHHGDGRHVPQNPRPPSFGSSSLVQDDAPGAEKTYIMADSKTISQKFISHIPFYNYLSPYRNNRWVASGDSLTEDAMDWLIMLEPECNVQQQQQSLCILGKTRCLAQGSNGPHRGVAFAHVRATQENLEAMILAAPASARSCVKFIEPDGELKLSTQEQMTSGGAFEPVVEVNLDTEPLPWFLDRIDARSGLDGTSDMPFDGGRGVDVYIAGSGLRTSHESFRNDDGTSRAKNVVDLTSIPLIECNATSHSPCAEDRHGHSTHCAGIIGGRKVGMAPGTTLHGVKFLDDDGVGSNSALVAALDWVMSKADTPAVFSVSVASRGVSFAVSAAIEAAVARGIAVVVAAGDDSGNACEFSPAYAQEAITVGATDKADQRAPFSNYGRCLDLYAPGTDIRSPGSTSDTSSSLRSGTSMAASAVAGAAALILWSNPAANVKVRLMELATAVDPVPGASHDAPNELLYINSVVLGGMLHTQGKAVSLLASTAHQLPSSQQPEQAPDPPGPPTPAPAPTPPINVSQQPEQQPDPPGPVVVTAAGVNAGAANGAAGGGAAANGTAGGDAAANGTAGGDAAANGTAGADAAANGTVGGNATPAPAADDATAAPATAAPAADDANTSASEDPATAAAAADGPANISGATTTTEGASKSGAQSGAHRCVSLSLLVQTVVASLVCAAMSDAMN